MIAKTFFNSVSNSSEDILQVLLDMLLQARAEYCIIGGLAVNAYVEPVVSLDLDIVVALSNLKTVLDSAKKKFAVETFEHSVNLKSDKSDLRIQIQTDPRYEAFISRATQKQVMGYTLRVASVEDVLLGKTWAYSDGTRRKSKRQKDLSDISRIIEAYPALKKNMPPAIQELV
jgi:hypothetical protein